MEKVKNPLSVLLQTGFSRHASHLLQTCSIAVELHSGYLIIISTHIVWSFTALHRTTVLVK